MSMHDDRAAARLTPRGVRRQSAAADVVPRLFETGTHRLPSSGQYGAAAITGLALFAVELLAAPLVFGITLAGSLFFWWLLDQPWTGRRRLTRHRGLTPRLLYLATMLLGGLWLSVMFVYRTREPSPPSAAPFRLFAHGTASTIAISLLAYAALSARTRSRERKRTDALRGLPAHPPPGRVR